MKRLALRLRHSMNTDLQIAKEKRFDEEKVIEVCYQICSNYWHRIQKVLALHQFKRDEEEIYFFKNIKPMFTSEIEFNNLLMHSCLFRPLCEKVAIENFWLRESLRLDRFIEANSEFVDYHHNGDTKRDSFFYLRRFNDVFPDAQITELEKNTCTRNDVLVAQYMALEKYTAYVQIQLDKLNVKTNEQ